jgi:hypothetical protein
MRVQCPDSLILPGLSDQTRTLVSVQCWQQPTSVFSSAGFAVPAGPRNLLRSVTR